LLYFYIFIHYICLYFMHSFWTKLAQTETLLTYAMEPGHRLSCLMLLLSS
jgi:hypothetical protein